MKEYGGYIELDTYRLPMLHEGAVALNCGRSCLAYLIRAKQIRKICLPDFLCDSVEKLCRREGVSLRFYAVGPDFHPCDVVLEPEEWLYLVNYYGQLDQADIRRYKEKYGRVIVDQSQAYFQMPVEKVDTLYTCRKFFGVADGAFLYTDARLAQTFPIDESFERMHFLLGRFERTASEFYGEYAANNRLFAEEPVKQMSKLTDNLLHAIDYGLVCQRRTDNFEVLAQHFSSRNRLRLRTPEGPFAYPLWVDNGPQIRKVLAQKQIYIPTLWPNVLQSIDPSRVEYDMVANILPIPCDQRYDQEEMTFIVKEILECLAQNASC